MLRPWQCAMAFRLLVLILLGKAIHCLAKTRVQVNQLLFPLSIQLVEIIIFLREEQPFVRSFASQSYSKGTHKVGEKHPVGPSSKLDERHPSDPKQKRQCTTHASMVPTSLPTPTPKS